MSASDDRASGTLRDELDREEITRLESESLERARDIHADAEPAQLEQAAKDAFAQATALARDERELPAVFEAELGRLLEERDVLGATDSVLPMSSDGPAEAPMTFGAGSPGLESEDEQAAVEDEPAQTEPLAAASEAPEDAARTAEAAIVATEADQAQSADNVAAAASEVQQQSAASNADSGKSDLPPWDECVQATKMRLRDGRSPEEIQREKGFDLPTYDYAVIGLMRYVDSTLAGSYAPHVDRTALMALAAGRQEIEKAFLLERHIRECSECSEYFVDLLDATDKWIAPAAAADAASANGQAAGAAGAAAVAASADEAEAEPPTAAGAGSMVGGAWSDVAADDGDRGERGSDRVMRINAGQLARYMTDSGENGEPEFYDDYQERRKPAGGVAGLLRGGTPMVRVGTAAAMAVVLGSGAIEAGAQIGGGESPVVGMLKNVAPGHQDSSPGSDLADNPSPDSGSKSKGDGGSGGGGGDEGGSPWSGGGGGDAGSGADGSGGGKNADSSVAKAWSGGGDKGGGEKAKSKGDGLASFASGWSGSDPRPNFDVKGIAPPKFAREGGMPSFDGGGATLASAPSRPSGGVIPSSSGASSGSLPTPSGPVATTASRPTRTVASVPSSDKPDLDSPEFLSQPAPGRKPITPEPPEKKSPPADDAVASSLLADGSPQGGQADPNANRATPVAATQPTQDEQLRNVMGGLEGETPPTAAGQAGNTGAPVDPRAQIDAQVDQALRGAGVDPAALGDESAPDSTDGVEIDGDPTDGVPDGADLNAGDPNAGDPNAGDPNAGDSNAGDPNAGDPTAANPAAGNPATGATPPTTTPTTPPATPPAAPATPTTPPTTPTAAPATPTTAAPAAATAAPSTPTTPTSPSGVQVSTDPSSGATTVSGNGVSITAGGADGTSSVTSGDVTVSRGADGTSQVSGANGATSSGTPAAAGGSATPTG